ncbi:ABC transporter ATP-binding protein [Corynebacterium uterequi]|uniref:ABC-type cobalt transport system, ATPase component n=1 Tax=Corynebacterium uterequi TaxID=1072256 RepID=A0A0G3HM26_9CORY|nr:ABC transporter ATP-binding protein [Corynebacterium uterequi]AKK12152.1 ABC-type cobalt transport system, ATPase component [Corynebacterium uterequi]
MANIVSLTDASFRYDGTGTGVDDLNLQLPRGSVTLLCGPSGSGKSTVVRLITGLVPHFYPGRLGGTVAVDGISIAEADLTSSGACCASVMQHPRQQFFTTEVGSELSFAPANHGLSAEVIRAAVRDAAAATGVDGLLDRRLGSLSGGQIQRVAFAQALAQQTDVIVCDEPTSNLDGVGIAAVASLIDRLRRAGTTLLVTEHRLHYLRGLIDQALYIDQGRIQHRFSGAEFFALSNDERERLGLRSLTDEPLTVPAPTDPSVTGLHVTGLRITRRRAPELTYPDMVFPAGAVTAVTGANGCGKTTLANVLCGFLRSNRAARMTLNGRALRASDCFLVMQDVRHQLFADRVDKEAHPDYLAPLGLAEVADRHPLSLSGGQQQRLVVATALEQHRDVIIFDEPTSGVDLRHLRGIATQLRVLAERGHVVIAISHDTEFLHACADARIDLTDTRKDTP